MTTMAIDNKEKEVLNVPPLRFPEFTGEWQCKAIEKVAPLQRGFDLPTQNLVEGIYPVIYSNGILQHHDKYKCEAPGLITGRSGTIGKFTYIDSGFYWPHNTSLWVTDFCGNCPKFIYYLYQTVHIEQFSTGSGVPTLNRNDVHRYKTSVPTAIVEQEKIAKFLSILDERIVTQNKIIEKLQSLIKGLNDNIHKGIKGETVCFSDLGEAYSGLSGKGGDDFGYGEPFITYMNVYQNTYISEKDYELVQIAPNEKQNSVQYGDALFTLSSETPEEVGIGAVYLGNTQKLYLNSFCFGIHFYDERVLPQYLAHFISSSSFRRAIYPLAQGSTRFNLQKNDFMKMKFLLPSLEKQGHIANTLDALHCRLANEKSLTEQYILLKKYLLSLMFI